MKQEETEAIAENTTQGGAPCDISVSRRTFVKGATVLTGSAIAGLPVLGAEDGVDASKPVTKLRLKITINGQQKDLMVDPRISLLDLLREQLQLTGTKKGCDHGQCGACTVLANGRRINSCLALAIVHDGDEIVSIEGLADGDNLHPVQQAFLDHDGYQCGYCTPGQILSAVALLSEAKKGEASFVTAELAKTGPAELTTEEIQERMSGNICRCGAYPGIVAAVRQAYRS